MEIQRSGESIVAFAVLREHFHRDFQTILRSGLTKHCYQNHAADRHASAQEACTSTVRFLPLRRYSAVVGCVQADSDIPRSGNMACEAGRRRAGGPWPKAPAPPAGADRPGAHAGPTTHQGAATLLTRAPTGGVPRRTTRGGDAEGGTARCLVEHRATAPRVGGRAPHSSSRNGVERLFVAWRDTCGQARWHCAIGRPAITADCALQASAVRLCRPFVWGNSFVGRDGTR